jgi:methylmalonyl-CoA mutase
VQELAYTWPTASNMSAPRMPAASTSTPSPPRLSFFFGIGMNFFMEVAKLRAARLLWHRRS